MCFLLSLCCLSLPFSPFCPFSQSKFFPRAIFCWSQWIAIHSLFSLSLSLRLSFTSIGFNWGLVAWKPFFFTHTHTYTHTRSPKHSHTRAQEQLFCQSNFFSLQDKLNGAEICSLVKLKCSKCSPFKAHLFVRWKSEPCLEKVWVNMYEETLSKTSARAREAVTRLDVWIS